MPPPTLTVSNPDNGHAHLFYGLTTPVGMSDAARDAPIRYAAAVQAALLVKLCADPGYAGLIAVGSYDWVYTLFKAGIGAEDLGHYGV